LTERMGEQIDFWHCIVYAAVAGAACNALNRSR
jgi:hypothetical protein